MKKLIAISILILLLPIIFSGCTDDDKQEYSKHEVDRFISIGGPGYPIRYTLKISKIIDDLELKKESGSKVVQKVEYEISPDNNLVVVENENEVAKQGGKPCVIIIDDTDSDEIYIHGYNLTDQKHNFKINYEIKTYEFKWDLDSAEIGEISDIPVTLKSKHCIKQWEVGDLNGDGELDSVDEDENGNFKLDFGEDVDADGYLDVNEDMDGDGLSDWRIDPDAEPIENKAMELKGDKENVFDIVKTIYDYLRDNFQYPNSDEMAYDYYMYGGRPKSAMRTLEDKYGDCDDQAILLISLCRALGIPAWLECGAIFDPSLKMWESHSWANVWVPLKDGGNIVACVDPANNQFLHRDKNRITEFIDDSGDASALEEYFISFIYTYSTSLSNGKRPDYSDEFIYINHEE